MGHYRTLCNLKNLIIIGLCAYVSCLCVCICTACVAGACRGQWRAYDTLGQELRMAVSDHVGTELNPGLLQEQLKVLKEGRSSRQSILLQDAFGLHLQALPSLPCHCAPTNLGTKFSKYFLPYTHHRAIHQYEGGIGSRTLCQYGTQIQRCSSPFY